MHLELGGVIALAALLGAVIGSFLNVVIYRLPRMLQAQWDADCAAHVAARDETPYTPAPSALTLCRPGSHCPHCQHPIRWHHNLPVIGWLWLRGRCAHCQHRISVRYPLVEIATAALFAASAWRWGGSIQTVVLCGWCATLLALALIDWDTTLLPDSLTLPLLWAGLLVAALDWGLAPLADAVWGAAAGYLSLWLVYWAFKLATGKDGMGHGDFKLLAALGAWLGWPALIPIILLSAVLGTVVGLGLQVTRRLREGGYMPFGPFLAGAGCVTLFAGTGWLSALLGV